MQKWFCGENGGRGGPNLGNWCVKLPRQNTAGRQGKFVEIFHVETGEIIIICRLNCTAKILLHNAVNVSEC